MPIKQIFPSFYYHNQFEDHALVQDDLLRFIYSKEYIENGKQKNWECKVHTTFGEESVLLSQVKSFEKAFTKNLRNFSKEIGLSNIDKTSISVPNIWYNIYKEFNWQENHDHCTSGAMFSGIYYLKFPEGSRSTIFHNDSAQIIKLLDYAPFIDTKSKTYDSCYIAHQPEVKEGDWVIFPSSIVHSVPAHTIGEDRITIAFNLRFEKK